ncbi:hypothetical protein ACLBOM_10030 [Escherichia coli]
MATQRRALFTWQRRHSHSQKGIPAFSIYGHDVQDADDTSIPADVEEKLLRFARAGLAVASSEVKAICRWAAFPWVSPVLLLITTSLNPGWE